MPLIAVDFYFFIEENQRDRHQEEKRKEPPGREEGDFPFVGHPFSPWSAAARRPCPFLLPFVYYFLSYSIKIIPYALRVTYFLQPGGGRHR